MTDVTDETSSKRIRHRGTWAFRFLIFAVMITAANQRQLLQAFGLLDTGPPRWILAGLLAAAFMAYAFLTSNEFFGDGASRSPANLLISGFTCLLGFAMLFWLYVGMPPSSPIFWVIIALFAAFGFLDWRAKRARKGIA
jgi:drug/metabolite transporter (DMT)-like permease